MAVDEVVGVIVEVEVVVVDFIVTVMVVVVVVVVVDVEVDVVIGVVAVVKKKGKFKNIILEHVFSFDDQIVNSINMNQLNQARFDKNNNNNHSKWVKTRILNLNLIGLCFVDFNYD